MNLPNRTQPSLPARAEALLEGWPAPSKSALEWEDRANATTARAREAVLGSTPDELLAAPLPASAEEGTLEPEPPADEPNLVAIARAAVAARASSSPKEVALEGLRAASRQRAVIADDADERPLAKQSEAHAVAARPQMALEPAPARVVQAPIEEAAARSEFPQTPRRGGLSPSALGGAALALAAGAVLYVALRHGEADRVLSSPSSERPVAALQVPKPVAEPAVAAPAPSAPAASAAANVPATPAPTAAPETAKAPAADDPEAKVAKAMPSKKDSLAFHVKESPKGSNKLVLEESDDSNTAAGVGAAQAPNPPTQVAQAPQAAPQSTGALPTQPSIGVIQGALGSVMTGARSCLVGQDAGSRAALTFGSDGRVRKVTVSGPAAGTPAEGCLISALNGARVPPFSDPEYSFALTVRPP